MFPKYIVLAHLPIDTKAMDFLPCEWVIFDGVHGKAQAEAKAKAFRNHFRSVQIREVSDII